MYKPYLTLCAAFFVALQTLSYAQEIQFYSPSIVRVTKAPGDTRVDRASLVVTMKPQAVKVTTTREGSETVYQSSALKIRVKGGEVSFYSKDGTLLLRDSAPSFEQITSGIDKGHYKVGQTFRLDPSENIYGVGLMENGKMSQRGDHRDMIQTNLEDFAHFFQSIKGYGIYWDNYSPTRLDDDPESGLNLTSQVGEEVDYYFMYGGSADGVISQMRQLTGSSPMLPLWTYGFHQSRERYKSSAELLDVLRKYRQQAIPLDGIIQDWQYWGSNYTWNAMDFINEDFANAQAMIDEIHERNAHISISVWASFGPQTLQYKELDARGELFHFETWPQSGLSMWPPHMDYPSGVRVYDCYSEGARDIYWKYLSKMHGMGIDAWWMDSTDPDHNSFKDSDLDEKCALGSYRSVRNLFPYMTVGGVDQHQRAVDKDKRVFILTRSYFAGQQRYGANTWTGDVQSNWGSLRNQVPMCLNYTLTANPQVNTDIGGFFANAYNRGFGDDSATSNPQYQELYTRWMQFGLFCPMMRSHGTEVKREIYLYGRQGEPIYDALRSAVEMRYRLLPYIYSTAWQVSSKDDSFMRALVMDFPNDPRVRDLGREYMFGRNLLVCPVVDPLYTKEKIEKAPVWPKVDWNEEKKYSVYLPLGADWYDYWTGEKFKGGQDIDAPAPISHSPLYVRAGSILPEGPVCQNTAERDWSVLTLKLYPGANAEFTLYEDEGDGYQYLTGSYTEIPLSWNEAARTLTIGERRGQYPGFLQKRAFRVQTPDGGVKYISYEGKAVKVKL